MEARVHQPLYELFLVLEPLRPRARELFTILEPLHQAGAPLVRGVDLYYRRSSDVALIALRYDERTFTRERLQFVIDLATGAGIPLLDPARMSEGDRRGFYGAYLSTYDIKIEDQPNLPAAFAALATRIDEQTLSTEKPTPARGALGKLAPAHQSVDVREAMPLAEQARLARSRADLRARAITSTKTPTIPVTRPPSADPAPLAPSNTIDVRFLRGGAWTTARLRALSVKGAYLVTGAPPRLGDSVHVALGFRESGALLRGTVYHVTTAADAMATGSSGFAVRFPVYPSAGRTQLIELLTAAREAGVTIKPPPTRHAVRFPVCWPVQVGFGEDSFHADALDVSEHGLFVATDETIEVGEEISIAVPMEEGDSVTARARIARVLPPREASPRGLRGGSGVELTGMSDVDRRMWNGFLDRVRKRTERRVVVGASPQRIDEIASALTSAGYSVTTGSDAGVLVRLADLEPRPPDAVVIEAGLAAQGPDHWLEQVFSARQVPCVTVNGDGRRTRCVVDRLLQVAA
ncbi:MAG TPA: PilZ domain-containing protein [Kofleriaceae bacterium]|jgi:hypothetical protein|nr:PilZ domain-containing protein [Kofleriaceae bacterium]